MSHKLSILIITGSKENRDSANLQAIIRLEEAIKSLGYPTVQAATPVDGLSLVKSYHGFGCVILDWDLPGADNSKQRAVEDIVGPIAAGDIINTIRTMDRRLPIFLITDKTQLKDIPLSVVKEVHEYIYLGEDTSDFIAGRVDFATRRYYEGLLPPYFRELKKFTEDAAYSWDAPGHMGGVAYLKHPVGLEFHKFFGENIMRADIGISTAQMGDWLEHIGPSNESECNAARIFGADWTFYVLGGSSASNRIVCQGAIGAEEMVVADRNCHKSLNHGLTLSRARAVYLKPTRNSYGMIGPIPLRCFEPDRIKKLIEESELRKGAVSSDPTYAVVTNCTYDGFCYDANAVVDLLSKSVSRVHFDEAWYAYAKFHPLYKGRFAMGLKNRDDSPTLFAVQSTHKMLPAFSMASMIHIKLNNKTYPNIEKDQFNEAFMMHGTTSPFYPMIASIDVATSMMDKPAGRTMMNETIKDAIGLRKAIVSVAQSIKNSDEKEKWFFGCYQPEKVTDPKRPEKPYDFVDAPDKLLTNESSCWTLKKGDFWHGFKDVDLSDESYCMLDPTKVTILCPGIDSEGNMSKWGIPGTILTRFLDSRRIEIARTGDYTVLVLFSVGTSKGKWGTLLEALLEFKRLYEGGASVAEVLPELAEKYPDRYGRDANGQPIISLKKLCHNMHSKMEELKLPELLNNACNDIPKAKYSSAETFQMLVRDKTKKVMVSKMKTGQWIAGHMLVPYPPGIPILMPGELLEEGNPQVEFLLALEKFNRKFPGFEREIHGIETDVKGRFRMRCVVENGVEDQKEDTKLQAEEASALIPGIHLRSMARSIKRGRS